MGMYVFIFSPQNCIVYIIIVVVLATDCVGGSLQ